MTFQVMLAGNQPDFKCGKVAINFVARRNIDLIPTVKHNTRRGFLLVSSPEATAFDLVGYPDQAGGLDNVATVLTELVEKLQPEKILAAACLSPLTWSQRLGYLLELVGADRPAAPLADFVRSRAKDYVPLRVRQGAAIAEKNPRWQLLINEKVEAEV